MATYLKTFIYPLLIAIIQTSEFAKKPTQIAINCTEYTQANLICESL